MLWIKRNLFFVLGMLVAVGLLGGGIYNILDKRGQDKDKTDEIELQQSTLQGFYQTKVFPSKENIALLKTDVAKLQKFNTECRPFFARIPEITYTGLQGFKSELVTMISKLNTQANSAGVQLHSNFNYSFQSQVYKLNISPNAMRTMAHQMSEIQQMCTILFGAKINRLEAVQRARTEDDQGPGIADADFVPEPIRVTPMGVIYPYRLTFRCFSSELAGVLDGFIKSPYGFVIKTVEVEAVPLDFAPPVPGFAPPGFMPPGGNPVPNPVIFPPRVRPPYTGNPGGGSGMQPGQGRGTPGTGAGGRGGRGGRGGGGGGTRMLELNAGGTVHSYQDLLLEAGGPAVPAKSSLVTLVNEKPFRVSMYLEVVELTK